MPSGRFGKGCYSVRSGARWRLRSLWPLQFRARLKRGAGRTIFFFFQAEDGIRDLIVTGVQTCALPISLQRDAARLAERLDPTDAVILLGSIATAKYLEPLKDVLGPRLRFPQEFIGRGDMSRGALMLRCAALGRELTYI